MNSYTKSQNIYIKKIKKKKNTHKSRLQPNSFTGICFSWPCCLYFSTSYLLLAELFYWPRSRRSWENPFPCKWQALFATWDTVRARNNTHFAAIAQLPEANQAVLTSHTNKWNNSFCYKAFKILCLMDSTLPCKISHAELSKNTMLCSNNNWAYNQILRKGVYLEGENSSSVEEEQFT